MTRTNGCASLRDVTAFRLNAVSVAGGRDVDVQELTPGGTMVPANVLYQGVASACAPLSAANPLPLRLTDGAAFYQAALESTAQGILAALQGTLTVSGALTISGTVDVTGSTVAVSSLPAVTFASPQHVIVDSATLGTVTVTGTVAATQSGTWSLGASSAVIGHVVVDSGTFTSANLDVALSTRASEATAASILAKLTSDPSTATLQTAGNASLSTLAGVVSGNAIKIVGADGSALASLTNGVPVQPGTSTTWDVSSRAARLIGALTGINGSGVATGANPVPVQLSSGSAVIAVGPQASATAIPTVQGFALAAEGTSLPTTGTLIKSGNGTSLQIVFKNSSSGTVFFQIHNTTTTPAGGAKPLWWSASGIANGSAGSSQTGTTMYGTPCSTAVYLVASSTDVTYTAIASTSIVWTLIYL